MRQTVLHAIRQHRLVAIVRGIPETALPDTLEALYAGGIRLVEITFSADKSRSDRDTAGDIALAVDRFAGRLLVGAGTVLTVQQAELAASAGAGFVLSPNTDPAVIDRTRALGLVSVPGALTPTEVQAADAAGGDIIKLFPAASLGSGYLAALRGPLPQLNIMAVGGITPDNMAEYFTAGAGSVGIGSNLVNRARVAARDFDGIRTLATLYAARAKGGSHVLAH